MNASSELKTIPSLEPLTRYNFLYDRKMHYPYINLNSHVTSGPDTSHSVTRCEIRTREWPWKQLIYSQKHSIESDCYMTNKVTTLFSQKSVEGPYGRSVYWSWKQIQYFYTYLKESISLALKWPVVSNQSLTKWNDFSSNGWNTEWSNIYISD